MKTNKIRNIQELRIEIVRLRKLSEVQENIIREDIAEIKESLKPRNILLSTVESVTGLKFDKKHVLENGLAAAALLMVRKYISKMESKAEDTVYDFTDRVFDRIRHFISKYMHVRKRYSEDKEEDTDL